jgi:hypothetical protein
LADSNPMKLLTANVTSDFGNELQKRSSPVPTTITHQSLISGLITLILIAAAVLSFLFLLYGGISWIMAGGDKDKTAKAQGTITAALIGLALTFSAWAVATLLGIFFGIDLTGSLTFFGL